jgi:hypothetical protein
VTIESGDATSGNDLTAGVIKSWIVNVKAISNKSSRSMINKVDIEPKIIWKE